MGRGPLELKAPCTHCEASIDLTAGEVMLLLPSDPMRPVTVAYECRACGGGSAVSIDPLVAAVLEEEGAVTVRNHPSLRHPASRRTDDPPFAYDDVLDLHELLQGQDWFDRVLSLCTHDDDPS